MLKIFRISLYALGGFFVYLVNLLSFVSLAPLAISNKLFLMALFGIIGLMPILAAMATSRFRDWRVPVGILIFSGICATLFVVFTMICIQLLPEPLKQFTDLRRNLFRDYFIGGITTASLLVLAAALLTPLAFILAFRNLVHDKTLLAATIAGTTFAVILIGVQLGLYLGVRKIITDMIDHTAAQLWIIPFGTQSVEESFPLLGDHDRHQALATPGVERVIPLVVGFADWNRPDGGITHVVVVGSDAEDGGLAPWNLRSGNWTDIKSFNGVGVDSTYLTELGVAGIGCGASIKSNWTDIKSFNDVGVDSTYLTELGIAGIGSHSVRIKALTEGIRSFTQTPYVFTTNARAREFFGVPDDKSTFLLVKAAPQADLARIQKELAARLPDLEVLTSAEFRRRSLSHWLFRTGVGIALIFGTILGVVIGAVIEAQTLYSATLDHIKEFAVLRVFGSSAGYVHRIILAQASVISIAGFALGTFCVVLVDRWSQQTALPMVVPLLLCVAILIVSLAIGAFSAIIAVLKVLRVDPAAVLMR